MTALQLPRWVEIGPDGLGIRSVWWRTRLAWNDIAWAEPRSPTAVWLILLGGRVVSLPVPLNQRGDRPGIAETVAGLPGRPPSPC
ncbi:hypothetical protein ACQPZP_26555 [Spirillospora sp. CA-142024]|uniref:hypothetical protein n=1 Tax=Spirillospora sp. CA-142024 TaxID=3240036 RepID=UPI003D8AA1AA